MSLWRKWNSTTVTWSVLKSDWYCLLQGSGTQQFWTQISLPGHFLNGLGTMLGVYGTWFLYSTLLFTSQSLHSFCLHTLFSTSHTSSPHNAFTFLPRTRTHTHTHTHTHAHKHAHTHICTRTHTHTHTHTHAMLPLFQLTITSPELTP